MLGDINWLWPTIGLTTQGLSHLSQTLEANLGLNSPRKLSAEAERELALVGEITGCICGSYGPQAWLYFRQMTFYSFSHRNSYAERQYLRMDTFSTYRVKN